VNLPTPDTGGQFHPLAAAPRRADDDVPDGVRRGEFSRKLRSPRHVSVLCELCARIVELLKRKKYGGPASFETLNPMVQATDPYQVAMRARAPIEPLSA
jgi:hypothetical protein